MRSPRGSSVLRRARITSTGILLCRCGSDTPPESKSRQDRLATRQGLCACKILIGANIESQPGLPCENPCARSGGGAFHVYHRCRSDADACLCSSSFALGAFVACGASCL